MVMNALYNFMLDSLQAKTVSRKNNVQELFATIPGAKQENMLWKPIRWGGWVIDIVYNRYLGIFF